MTNWYCNYQISLGQAYYYNGFESPSQGPERGERVFKSEPHCGRFSLKNPQYLFYGGQTKDMLGRVLQSYDAARYQQVTMHAGRLTCCYLPCRTLDIYSKTFYFRETNGHLRLTCCLYYIQLGQNNLILTKKRSMLCLGKNVYKEMANSGFNNLFS